MKEIERTFNKSLTKYRITRNRSKIRSMKMRVILIVIDKFI